MPPTFLQILAERDSVAEKTALLRLEQERADYAQAEAMARTAQMLEHTDWDTADPYMGNHGRSAGLGSAANDLMHYQNISWNNARPGSRRHGALPPYYRTEMQHWHFVDAARTLEGLCPTAACILDVLTQFAVFTGFTYTITEKNAPDVPEPAEGEEPAERPTNPLVEEIQTALDKWMKEVNWYAWELELFRRSRRDGEAFLILDDEDAGPSGLVGLRSVEPEQVKAPQDPKQISARAGSNGEHTWRFGILTTKRDTSKPLAYWVVSQYNDAQNMGEMYAADEVFHLKTEWVDRMAKRGVSDFFCVANDIPGTRKLLRSLRESGVVQANVAWVEEMPPGMSVAPMGGTNLVTSRTGDTRSARTMDGPEVIRTLQGHKYTAGPLAGTGQSETLIQVLQAALRNIGARWQMPEGLVSGDASNANLASALVAEAPFVHAMAQRQWFYRCEFKRLLERVLDRAAVEGVIGGGEALFDEIEISIDMPPVVPRKAKEETERNALLNERGILSNQTWSSREDLDFEEEQANIAVDPIEPPSIMLGMQEGDIAEGEAEDDTASENSSQTDNDGSTGRGSNRPRGRNLGAKSATTTSGATGTNREG